MAAILLARGACDVTQVCIAVELTEGGRLRMQKVKVQVGRVHALLQERGAVLADCSTLAAIDRLCQPQRDEDMLSYIRDHEVQRVVNDMTEWLTTQHARVTQRRSTCAAVNELFQPPGANAAPACPQEMLCDMSTDQLLCGLGEDEALTHM